jgi:hypothetical protein
MMATRKWLDNAFWHNEEKQVAEAILIITDDEGREISQVVTVRNCDVHGEVNPDWVELMDQVGPETIDASTAERKERKARESEEEDQRKKAEKNAALLEHLFEEKILVLEIDEIKNTKNKTLKKKLRRSKNRVEMNLYAQLILMEELGLGFVTDDSE